MRYMQAKPQRKRGPSRGLVYYSTTLSTPTHTSATEVEEKSQYTEPQLLGLTNAKLRDILASFDGAPSGNGKTKAQLVSAILAAQG